jgi:CRISPR-associated endonuclease/helicase Cas3
MIASTWEPWRAHLPEEHSAVVGALWGKSNAGGRPNLLIQHLFDALAVAEQIWDGYLAPSLQQVLDDATGGNGRAFYSWLCGVHDVGKASPAFQGQVSALGEAVSNAGLSLTGGKRDAGRWRHEKASGLILLDCLAQEWQPDQLAWVWPLIAGHHGVFYSKADVIGLNRRPRTKAELHGAEDWAAVQRCLTNIVTAAAGYPDLNSVEPRRAVTRAEQLALSGFIIMADWLASDGRRFVGIDDLGHVSLAAARSRALRGWRDLGVRGGWGRLAVPPTSIFKQRFNRTPRPSQRLVMDAASQMGAPGLMIVEAPMGEGKTEAALAAAETLAARFGADGVFVGMPTQATSDPMFERTLSWLSTFEARPQVALLHGKRLFNEVWRGLLDRPPDDGDAELDEHGLPRPYGRITGVCEDGEHDDGEHMAPAEWFLGRKRGLLAANCVGTIDQALFAATRTRHVALRYAGLAGKVVVLDEVHAADVYMAQFLGELLNLLGNARVPVILLSATLAPAQRRELACSYLAGALAQPDVEGGEAHDGLPGYPAVTTVWAADGRVHTRVAATQPWRADVAVGVALLPEPTTDDGGAVVGELRRRLHDGGCVLVLRNTVARAQQTARALREVFGDAVVLLHSRFTAADRAERTERLLHLLGPEPAARPERLVVVATQVAEQSFDVDVDLLVTDVAPIDLLLQRVGRLHRHRRDPQERPAALRVPEVVITGFRFGLGDLPWFPRGCEAIYGRHHLLRSLALAWSASVSAEGPGWSIPADVPTLVARGYEADETVVPAGWARDEQTARGEWQIQELRRAETAKSILLTSSGQQGRQTLDGLHRASSRGDAEAAVHVRDGDMASEIILIRRRGDRYETLGGEDLGLHGERVNDGAVDVLRGVLGGSVRLPVGGRYESLAGLAKHLGPLSEWKDHPWLMRANVLVLDAHGSAEIGGGSWRLTYSTTEGLTVVEQAKAT